MQSESAPTMDYFGEKNDTAFWYARTQISDVTSQGT